MTLDETIKHAEEVAERLEISCKRDWMGEDNERCASEHRQLAEWLKELKQLREQQPCEDAISRQPERKKGKWIRHDEIKNVYGGIYIECSECGEKYVVQHILDEKYCRNCGADMRGEQNEL